MRARSPWTAAGRSTTALDGVFDGDNYTFSLAADGEVSFEFDPATNLMTVVLP